MRASLYVLVVGAALFGSSAAFAQSGGSTPPPASGSSSDEWKQPPLVSAPGAETPPAATNPQEAPTPPPPGYQPQGSQRVPYPYSPYGQTQQQQPPAEVGLIITESLFGALTAGGTAALTGLLLLPVISSFGSPITDILFIGALATVPLSVASTELSLANGSRYYTVESWAANLAALAGEAGSIALFYALGGFPMLAISPAPVVALIVGNLVLVPALTTIAINLTKTPRYGGSGGGLGALLRYDDSHGLRVGVPVPQPIVLASPTGPKFALGATLATGRF